MEPKTAMAVALVAGALAVGLVAADTVWSLRSTLEAQEDGQWTAVAGRSVNESPREPGFGCASSPLRLVVDNDKPFPDQVDVVIVYSGANGTAGGTILDDAWSLGAFEVRTHEFAIPADAFEDGTRSDGFSPTPQVTVTVGDEWLSTCVRAPAEG